MEPQWTQRLWLAPSSPVENQTVTFEYFVKGFALFALDSPQTIENPVPRDHHDSYSILSRKAYVSGGKGLSLLVEPTTCGLAVLTTQNRLPHNTAGYMLPVQTAHSQHHHYLLSRLLTVGQDCLGQQRLRGQRQLASA